MLKSLTPNLMVEDVRATINFYRDVLGFEARATVPEDDGANTLNWASIGRDGVELMLQSRESLGGDVPALANVAIGASQSFYIGVEGIDDLYQTVKAGGLEIVADMHPTFYGTREFYFRDVNGYILCFAQTLEPTGEQSSTAG